MFKVGDIVEVSVTKRYTFYYPDERKRFKNIGVITNIETRRGVGPYPIEVRSRKNNIYMGCYDAKSLTLIKKGK